MRKDTNQKDIRLVPEGNVKLPWSKPALIDLNVSETAGVKARYQASEVAIFSSKAPTEEWGPS